MATTATEKSRLTVNETERTLVEQARRVEKARVRVTRAQEALVTATDQLTSEEHALTAMVLGDQA